MPSAPWYAAPSWPPRRGSEAEWRTHLIISAAHAHAEAEQRIQDAEAQGWDMREPRRRLQELRGALAVLQGEQQRAA